MDEQHRLLLAHVAATWPKTQNSCLSMALFLLKSERAGRLSRKLFAGVLCNLKKLHNISIERLQSHNTKFWNHKCVGFD